MPQITAIKPQKRRKRVNIFLDGQFAFGADLETLAKTDLKVGQVLSERKIEEIVKEAELAQVFARVLKFLSFRPRSEKELTDWFLRKEVGFKTQALIRRKLEKQKLLDDKEFSRWWLEQRLLFRPQGIRLVRFELKRRGVSENIIEEIFQEAGDSFSEKKLAEKAALKKLRSLKNLSQEKTREKLSSFLLRRGFPWEIACEVIENLI